MIIPEKLRNSMIKRLTKKLTKMRANGSNCADILAKLERLKSK